MPRLKEGGRTRNRHRIGRTVELTSIALSSGNVVVLTFRLHDSSHLPVHTPFVLVRGTRRSCSYEGTQKGQSEEEDGGEIHVSTSNTCSRLNIGFRGQQIFGCEDGTGNTANNTRTPGEHIWFSRSNH